MKKIRNVLMIAVVMLTAICHTVAADAVIKFDDLGTTFMYASNDEAIWLVGDDAVRVYDLDDFSRPAIEYQIEPVSHIYANDEGLFVCREADGVARIELLDDAGSVVNTWTLPGEMYIQQFIVQEQQLYAVVSNTSPMNEVLGHHAESRLYRFSLGDGAGEFCMMNSVVAIAALAPGNVLCLYTDEYDNRAVGEWSEAQRAIVESYELSGMEFSSILASGDGCYLLSDRGIHYLSFATGAVALTHPAQAGSERWLGLQRAGGLIVTEDFATGQIKTFPLDAAQYGGALTLVNVLKYNDKRISAAANMLTDAHPDIDVNYVDVEDAKLATALMANEPGYDILMLSNYTLDDYRQSGVVLDISDCAAIWDVVDDCWIDMPYLIGPKRDAVPLYIMPQVLTINTDMYGVFDGDIERQPSSWSELYAQAQVIDESGTALISSNIRFPEFFDQYIVWCALKGEVNFDTALFRNGLLGWREAFENGIIVDFGEGDALLMGNVVGNYAGCDDIVLLPALDGETIYPCNTYSLVISCTSDKQDIAKEFLSYYVSVEAQSAADVNSMAAGLLKDSSLYVCSDPEFPQPTQEQQELRAHLLKYGASLSHNTDFYLLAGDQLELFMIGDIELDELVRTLNELYQMTQLG